jgi:hypothetical protein
MHLRHPDIVHAITWTSQDEKVTVLKAPHTISSKSKDINRVHSVKNAVFRTSHGFAKLTPFTRHQKQIKYSKKNLICQQPDRRCVFSQNYRENAVRNAKSGIFKEKTLSSFISGQNFSTITVSDLFYSHKKYGWAFEKLLFDFESWRSGLPTDSDIL